MANKIADILDEHNNTAETRRVSPIPLPDIDFGRMALVASAAPVVEMVNPTELYIESAYQRDLSFSSIRLVRKMIKEWDWRKFKPPICAMREDTLVIIDGQHTAIAAATLGLSAIPVMVVEASALVERADAFVAHNRDRVAMQPLQVFHASLAAADASALAIMDLARATGVEIPRSFPLHGRAMPGQFTAVNDIRSIYANHGADVVRRIFTICVGAGCAPMGRTEARGLGLLLTEGYFADVAKMKDSRIANAVRAINERDGGFDHNARKFAFDSGQPQMRATAVMIADACKLPADANAG